MKWGFAAAILFVPHGQDMLAQSPRYYVHMDELVKDCKAATDATTGHPTEDSLCYGYIQGAVDTFHNAHDLHWTPKNMSICIPPNVKVIKLIHLFLDYVEEEPGMAIKYPGAEILWDAWHPAFPCTE
jgi:hypothetical protein